MIAACAVATLLPTQGPARLPQVPQEPPPVPDEPIGILFGDSVVQGFGSSPVLYNERSEVFLPDKYRFKPEADKPIESLAGYKGLPIWLNRAVPGNPSQSLMARWKRDVEERADRGFQKKSHRIVFILASVGLTDIGAAVGTPNLLAAEASLRQNLLVMVQMAKAEGIRMCFLMPPDPSRAPMGRPFRNQEGTEVKPFCESHEYDEQRCQEFEGALHRIRRFMTRYLPRNGAEVIDYARILPTEYFRDTHHPTDAGYVELARLLREKDPGKLGMTSRASSDRH